MKTCRMKKMILTKRLYLRACIKPVTRVLLFVFVLIIFGFFISGFILRLFAEHNLPSSTYSDPILQYKYSLTFMTSKQVPNKYAENITFKKTTTQRHLSYHHNENDIPANDKMWTRISDDVFVYSAYLETRNIFASNPMINNSFQRFPKEGLVNNAETQGQMNAGDSDKLTHFFLVRIVGMKAVPPLRDFIKTDILDWFRMKHELDYSQKYKCKLFFTTLPDTKLQSIPSQRVTYTVIEEGVKIYAGCYFNCYFAMNRSVYRNVKSVALANNLQVALYPTVVPDYPTKLINVGTKMITAREKSEQQSDNGSNIHFRKKSLAICVRPLFGPFDDLEKLIQFISYYHLMGVTHFNFYPMSISPRVRKYLLEVMARMTETGAQPHFILNNWNLPTGNTSELWDYGTLAALNDCLFANIDQEFVIFVDVDEFIVPKIPTSSIKRARNDDYLPTLWTIIDSYNKSETYQYLIRNTFFCHEFCGKSEDETKNFMNFLSLSTTPKEQVERKPDMTPLLSTSLPADNRIAYIFKELSIFKCFVRTKRVWNAAMRSKFIVNPREILAVGHHLSTKYVKNIDFRFSGKSVQVDPNIAVLHHYRECSSISTQKHPVLTRQKEIDKTILKFQVGVFDNLQRYYLPQFASH